MNDRIIFSCVLAFGAGVLIETIFDFGWTAGLFFFLLAVAVGLFYAGSLRFGSAGRADIFVPVLLILFFIGFGTFRMTLASESKESSVLDGFVGRQAELIGVIISEPDDRENHTILSIETESADVAGSTTTVKTGVQVFVPHFPEFEYGDRILMSGVLKKPESFGEAGEEFDYPAFLSKDGIYYQMFYPKMALLEKRHGSVVKEVLFSVKNSFIKNVSKVIPEPESSLLSGLVVGAKHSLGADWLDKFRKAGVIHIVVLSGYNISIVADFIMKIFSFLPIWANWSAGVLAIIFFALMTGGSATVVRASLMAVLVIIARATGRNYAAGRALVLAGFLMVLHNPKILVFDASFQLSFLATLALIYFSPIIEQRIKFLPEKFKIKEIAVTTIATQIFVLPLLLYRSGELSLVSLPVNILILGFIPATMLFGFLTGVAGFIFSFLSLLFAYPAHFLLWYELAVVEKFSALPFASIGVPFFPIWAVVISYVLIILLIAKYSRKQKTVGG